MQRKRVEDGDGRRDRSAYGGSRPRNTGSITGRPFDGGRRADIEPRAAAVFRVINRREPAGRHHRRGDGVSAHDELGFDGPDHLPIECRVRHFDPRRAARTAAAINPNGAADRGTAERGKKPIGISRVAGQIRKRTIRQPDRVLKLSPSWVQVGLVAVALRVPWLIVIAVFATLS
jgi:hypothetical protein